VQLSFCIERSIHWRPNGLIPAPIFYFLIFLQDTLDWAPRKKNPKVGVLRNKCSHKQALCILKCLPFIEEKIPHVTCPSTVLQMFRSGLYGFKSMHIFNGIMCKQNHLKKKKTQSFGLFFVLAHFEVPCIVHKQDHFLHI